VDPIIDVSSTTEHAPITDADTITDANLITDANSNTEIDFFTNKNLAFFQFRRIDMFKLFPAFA
jgi:hypothetical protein